MSTSLAAADGLTPGRRLLPHRELLREGERMGLPAGRVGTSSGWRWSPAAHEQLNRHVLLNFLSISCPTY